MDFFNEHGYSNSNEQQQSPEYKDCLIPDEIIELWMNDAYDILKEDGVKKEHNDIDYSLLLDYMLNYFEGNEEYEKCALLHTLQKKHFGEK